MQMQAALVLGTAAEDGPCAGTCAQVYSLDKVADYRHALETQRLGVPYFVRDPVGFEKSYPKGGRSRCARCMKGAKRCWQRC
jgi:hypothetical protein